MDLKKLKPSELIRVALDDLWQCQHDPAYKIAMDDWHRPYVDGKTGVPSCLVCLGGAVMAQTLKVDITHHVVAREFERLPGWECLEALDLFRTGAVHEAFLLLELPLGKVDEYVTITPYNVAPNEFVTDMNELAYDLEAKGY